MKEKCAFAHSRNSKNHVLDNQLSTKFSASFFFGSTAEQAVSKGTILIKFIFRDEQNNKTMSLDWWIHDAYNAAEQAPKSDAELVQTYGHNIRNAAEPPVVKSRPG